MRHQLNGKRHMCWTSGVTAVIACVAGRLRMVVWGMAVSRDERGAVMVEYALVLTLLSLGFIAGMKAVELATWAALNNLQNELMQYALRNGT